MRFHAQSARGIRAHMCAVISLADRPSGGLLSLALCKRSIGLVVEPDRAGSRRRCRCVPLPAAPRRAGAVSRRYSLSRRPFANVGVAGSSPVSCSRKCKRPRLVRSGAFSLVGLSFESGAFGRNRLHPIQRHSAHLLAGQDRCSCWILLTNFDRPPSLRSWGSRVRIAPGSPFLSSS